MVGIDIVQVSRLRRLLTEHATADIDLFTPAERDYCGAKRDRYPHLAARFAAKEAVLKALGSGLGPAMRWTDVEVVNAALGRPSVRLHGAVRALADARGCRVEITLSHTGDYAVAQAMLVGAA
ncbi:MULTISPECIES: holo-ACP synthase [Actinoplanes]|uniref:holo-ACP synthase n=1 Tax=Actinoplanes TaxID=1865 RepID=UPI0005F2ECC2|nr:MULTISPECIES: holo-ACP synthase [Actinoplanes]GLY07028.1 holo-[acyl-carrier-protein] synthase [Actinoplanes sp. NBRC 101535]